MDIIIAHLPNLALAYFVFFLAVASPGPATLAIAGASMSLGRRQGMAKAAGIVSGSLLWGMFAVFGMVAFISSFAGVLYWQKIAGRFCATHNKSKSSLRMGSGDHFGATT